MNQLPSNTPLSSQDDEAKTHALIAYALMFAGLFTVLFWFVGGIWAIVKKSDVEGSRFSDHYNNLINTFWWGILWAVIGGLLSLILVGYIILGVLWLWCIYQLIKGLAKLTSNRPFGTQTI